MTPLQKQSLKLFCALEVVLPSHECRGPGAGMAEEPLDTLEEGLFSSICVCGVGGGEGVGVLFFPFFLKLNFSDTSSPGLSN